MPKFSVFINKLWHGICLNLTCDENRKNILGALLLIIIIWANARAAVLTNSAQFTRSVQETVGESFEVDVYVANGILYVEFDKTRKEKIHVEVYDITGKRTEDIWLPKKESIKHEVELTNHLKSGLYIVKVSTSKQVKAIKLQL